MIWEPIRKEAARFACAAYAGTPHRNRMAVPGAGVDCIHLVSEILFAAAIIDRPTLPAYDERIGLLRERNVIEDILLRHLHAELVPPTEPAEFGDVIICRCGRQSNHVGILIDGEMWHVPAKGAVGPEALENWLPRIQSFIRITGTGLRRDPRELVTAELAPYSSGM